MRQHLARLSLSTALICGGVLAAAACPQSTAMKDTSAAGTIQLAQAGGASGGSSGGAGSTAGGSAGSGAATPGHSTGGSGAQGRGPIIQQDTPMRQPGTPTAPTTPGSSGTTTSPSR